MAHSLVGQLRRERPRTVKVPTRHQAPQFPAVSLVVTANLDSAEF